MAFDENAWRRNYRKKPEVAARLRLKDKARWEKLKSSPDALAANYARQRAYGMKWRALQKRKEATDFWAQLRDPQMAIVMCVAKFVQNTVKNAYHLDYIARRERNRKLTPAEFAVKLKEWRATSKARLLSNPEKLADRRRKDYESAVRWRKKNRKQYDKIRLKDPIQRLAGNMRAQVRAAIRKTCGATKQASTIALVGCSGEHLRRHLESMFQPGMAWDNMTNKKGGWSLDHVRPLASFDLRSPEQQRAAFHYSNLKPEWHQKNISKNSIWNGRKWRYSDHNPKPQEEPHAVLA